LTFGAKAAASGVAAVDLSALTDATATITVAGGSNANNVTYTTANVANATVTITGGSGNDTFKTGSTANVQNVFTGGSGTNTFNFKNIANNDVEDLKGSDVLTVGTGDTNVAAKVTADYVATAASTNSSNAIADVTLTSQSVGVDINMSASTVATGYTIAGFAGGTTGGETLVGSSQSDVITGDTGADNVSGGGGADALAGGAGADTVSGGAGIDTITIAAGKDSITGGDASDIYILANDVDKESAAADAIVFTDLAVGESLRLTSSTGTFNDIHSGVGGAITGADANDVFTPNLSTDGATPAVQAMGAGDIIIDFGSVAGGTTGIVAAMAAADGASGVTFTESGGGAVSATDEFLYTVRNTTNNTTELGIVTEVGGAFSGAAETFELIAVSTNTLTSLQVATLVSIV
jgi:hypothetical protein